MRLPEGAEPLAREEPMLDVRRRAFITLLGGADNRVRYQRRD
jgi:hypothetical protein